MDKVKQKFHSIKNFFRGAGFSPRIDWIISLSVFLLIIIMISITSTIMFFGFSSNSFSDTDVATTSVGVIDRDALKDIAGYFKNRSTSAEPDVSVFVDPSF